jgi:hypothetical protein
MAGEFARTHTELREVTCFAGPQTVRGILMRFTHPRLRSNTRARARTWSGASQSPAHAYLGFVRTHLRLCSDARVRGLKFSHPWISHFRREVRILPFYIAIRPYLPS